MKKVAIDLTWVRHQKVGGTESCVRNLLNGMMEVNPVDISISLILAKDNIDSFKMFDNSCFEILVGNVESENQRKRVIWQNTKLGKLLRNNNIDILLEPIYSTPFCGMKKIKIISTIHDLQALHYPEYFSTLRVMWMRMNWEHSVKKSERVIGISSYVRDDIIHNLNASESKVITVYDAIDLKVDECNDIEGLKKYGIKNGGYFYTVSSLLPHKNLNTIIKALAELKNTNNKAICPLVISGIGGKSKQDLLELAKENAVEDYIILTSFVDNAERNMLYKNCKVFIYPSVFEGFGMPPIEAMAMGVPVLTTKCTSLEEVTGGLLNYVENPLDEIEWCSKLVETLHVPNESEKNMLLNAYNRKVIANDYFEMIRGL